MTLNDFTLVQKFPLDLPPNKYKDSIEINVDDPILEPLIESNEKVCNIQNQNVHFFLFSDSNHEI